MNESKRNNLDERTDGIPKLWCKLICHINHTCVNPVLWQEVDEPRDQAFDCHGNPIAGGGSGTWYDRY